MPGAPPQKKDNTWMVVAIVVTLCCGSIPVVGIISAIAIPNLLRSRMSANEAAAIGALKTIAGAQSEYTGSSSPSTYASTLELLHSGAGPGGVGFLDGALGKGVKSGYTFKLQVGGYNRGTYWAWSATAWPISYRTTGIRSFYIDESQVIRGMDNGGALLTDERAPIID